MSTKKLFVLVLIEDQLGGESFEVCATLADSLDQAARNFGGVYRSSGRTFVPGPETADRLATVAKVLPERVQELREWTANTVRSGELVLKLFERPLLA